jgi:hypothetical protein
MKQVLGTGLRASGGTSILVLSLGIAAALVAPYLPAALGQTSRVVAVFLAAGSMKIFTEMFTCILAALQRPSFIGAGNTVVNAAGPLLGVALIDAGFGVYGIPAALGLVSVAFGIALFLRVRAVDRDLLVELPPFSRAVFMTELWPLVRARWLALIPTAFGPGSDRVIAAVTSGSRALVTSFTLTGRLPDLLSMIVPSVAVSTVPALAYLSDAKDRNPVAASRDLLALVTALGAGASMASLAVLRPFLALWVPSIVPLGPWARIAMCVALFGRCVGGAGAAVLNGRGHNQALPRLSWINAIATILLGGAGGLLFGIDGVAIGFGVAGLCVLMPLMVHALADDGILDAPTLRRFAIVSAACALTGFLVPRLVLAAIGGAPRWSTIATAAVAAGIATGLTLFAVDSSMRTRAVGLLRARAGGSDA